MFDRHINESWKAAFPNRNLIAWSASPLLLFPTTYTGEDGYFSDTEESDLISMKGIGDIINHDHPFRLTFISFAQRTMTRQRKTKTMRSKVMLALKIYPLVLKMELSMQIL